MYRVIVLTERGAEPGSFPWALDEEGISYHLGTELELTRSWNGDLEMRPQAALLDLDSVSDDKAHKLVGHCRELGLPLVAVVSADHLKNYDRSLYLDDFIIRPFHPGELLVRVDQAILRLKGPQNRNVIKVGDLLIDLDRYDVSVMGRKVLLTYKEYQLLALLASNPGKVYTRDSLLSQVWGYDYFGGTRTVDVHIRRLRSKIEDSGQSFIETIWNVGYRFKIGP